MQLLKRSQKNLFNKFHIWTRDHVKDYLGRKPAQIWILRVYKLNEPQILKRNRGMLYANVNKPVKLEGKPVIPDDEFNKLKEEILNTKQLYFKIQLYSNFLTISLPASVNIIYLF